MKNLFILSIIIIFMTSCSKTIEQSKLEEKSLYSLDEYLTLHGNETQFIGDEYIKILNNESLLKEKYDYALKSLKTLPLNEADNDFSKLLEKKELFNNKIFKPFNFTSLSRAIYHKDKALLSFGFKQDKWSVVFADFLLKIENKKLLIYTLEHAVGCGGAPITIFEQEEAMVSTIEPPQIIKK